MLYSNVLTLSMCNFSLTFLHRVFSNVSSNCVHKRMHSHIGCICLTFLHCAFSNVSSKSLDQSRQSHTGCICLSFLHFVLLPMQVLFSSTFFTIITGQGHISKFLVISHSSQGWGGVKFQKSEHFQLFFFDVNCKSRFWLLMLLSLSVLVKFGDW